MASKIGIFGSLQKIRSLALVHRQFASSRVVYNKPTSSQNVDSNEPNAEVPGLSSNVVKITSDPVGPGAAKSTNYKNPEYFLYSNTSYFEAEVEMSKYRCPQPSACKKA